MGRKKGWFSAIRSVFSFSSTKKPYDESYKVHRNSRHVSLIPRFGEPSSIEKILGEADKLSIRPPTLHDDNEKKYLHLKFFDDSSFSHQGVSASTARSFVGIGQTDPSPRIRYICATLIQASFRGYMVRKNMRSLRGMLRLQGVMRGHNARLQTIAAMKQTQILVRIQLQVHSMRLRVSKNNSLNQIQHHIDKETESNMSRWTMNRIEGHWDDSLLSKEKAEQRSRSKVEATMKRQRAIAYSQSQRANQARIQGQGQQKLKSNGYPKWWNWLESHLPSSSSTTTKRNVPSSKSNIKHQNQPMITTNTHSFASTSKPRLSASYNPSLKDDDSFTSCPSFITPSYMIHTASSLAKSRENNGNEDRNLEKNRFSLGETPSRRSDKPRRRKSIGDLSIDSFLSFAV